MADVPLMENPMTAVADTIIGGASGAATRLKNNLSASAAPAVTDDSGDGYAIGSRWIDTTADKEYVALDVSVGAAVWTETTAAGGAATTFHGAQAYSAGTQVITNGTTTTLNLGTQKYDTDALYFTSAAALTGTVSKAAASATVTGSGTSFTTELAVNQIFVIPGTADEYVVVKSIESDTSLTAWRVLTNTASGQTGTRVNTAFAVPAGLGGYWSVGISGEMNGGAGTGTTVVELRRAGVTDAVNVPAIFRRVRFPQLGYNISHQIDPFALVPGDLIQLMIINVIQSGSLTIGDPNDTYAAMRATFSLVGA